MTDDVLERARWLLEAVEELGMTIETSPWGFVIAMRDPFSEIIGLTLSEAERFARATVAAREVSE